ncbi:MAG: ribosome biogenesis GTPase Der [Thermoanaerobaculia bacterium]
MPLLPSVAIVGRPNVGKSTLFNRFVGRRQAIVHDRPGVTRDRISGIAEIASGHKIHIVDTGGLVPGHDPLGLNKQVLQAVQEADFCLLLVDGRQGLVTADEQVWHEIRPLGKPTLLVVNKGDTRLAQENFREFHSLGFSEIHLLSAEHGTGFADLCETLVEVLPTVGVEVSSAACKVAIVGRPNVGKSSIVNRILGEERVLVAPTPGTTRDPIDSTFETDGKDYLLIDTAGIRRRSKAADTAEEIAIMMARRQIARADLALLVIDAAHGVTTGDLSIAGVAWEEGRATVVVVNKWDLLSEPEHEALEKTWERLAMVLSSPPRVNISALTGRGMKSLFPQVSASYEAYIQEIPTSELNRVLQAAVTRHPAPARHGRPWKFYYATQVSQAPPTFILFANRKLDHHSNYRRYLENYLHEEFELAGIPARLVIREKKSKGSKN